MDILRSPRAPSGLSRVRACPPLHLHLFSKSSTLSSSALGPLSLLAQPQPWSQEQLTRSHGGACSPVSSVTTQVTGGGGGMVRKDPGCFTFANFCDVNILPMAAFKLPNWHHRMRSWKGKLTTDSHKPVKPTNTLSRALLAVAYMQYYCLPPLMQVFWS